MKEAHWSEMQIYPLEFDNEGPVYRAKIERNPLGIALPNEAIPIEIKKMPCDVHGVVGCQSRGCQIFNK